MLSWLSESVLALVPFDMTSKLRITTTPASRLPRAQEPESLNNLRFDEEFPSVASEPNLRIRADSRPITLASRSREAEEGGDAGLEMRENLPRSYSLPAFLTQEEEEEEVMQATLQLEGGREALEAESRLGLGSGLAERGRCGCEAPEDEAHIFRVMNAPCVICRLRGLFSFVVGWPTGPGAHFCRHSHHSFLHQGPSGSHAHSQHHWWHHIGRAQPEIHMDSPQLIRHWDYPFEEHRVRTEDGYLLSLHRIPNGRHRRAQHGQRRPAVLLQHGLEGSSADWIANDPAHSAGFLLADAGFDVWLGNMRGNKYALSHDRHSQLDPAFWDFSWDEMVAFDLPAIVDYVLESAGQDALHYVAHSQGSLVGFARLGAQPYFARKLKTFTALAPVLTLRHVRGFLKYIAVFTSPLRHFSEVFGVKQFLPNNWVSKLVAKVVCEWEGTSAACSNVVLAISGPDTGQLDWERLPVYLSHIPSGTSTRNVAHFGQMISTGRFQHFDFGPKENIRRYGTPLPPQYSLGKVSVPTYLFWGRQDWLSNEADIATSLLPHLADLRANVALQGFNHHDFIWGQRAADEVYAPIIGFAKALEAEEARLGRDSTSDYETAAE